MKIETHKGPYNTDQTAALIKEDNNPGGDRKLKISDLAWEDTLYIALWDGKDMTQNIIIKRKSLEKFLKQARKNAKKFKADTHSQLKALKIGTRFITEAGDEWIKVTEDSYLETDEVQATDSLKSGLGFLPGDLFRGKIKIVDD